jgi:hypothetical protein
MARPTPVPRRPTHVAGAAPSTPGDSPGADFALVATAGWSVVGHDASSPEGSGAARSRLSRLGRKRTVVLTYWIDAPSAHPGNRQVVAGPLATLC